MTKERLTDSALRNVRAWASARPDMSGSQAIVDAIDELLERRAGLLTSYGAALPTVTRYYVNGNKIAGVSESPTGEFVRYDDIKHLLHHEPTGVECICPTCGLRHGGCDAPFRSDAAF